MVTYGELKARDGLSDAALKQLIDAWREAELPDGEVWCAGWRSVHGA